MSDPTPSVRVTVVGAGTMGHGIAYAAALAGCAVTLTDSRVDALPHALARIGDLLAGGVKRGKLTKEDRAAVLSRLQGQPSLPAAVAPAEVVIEAILEDLVAKQQLFRAIERAALPTALLATNTSSLSIASIAAVLQEPARLIGLHFFNPVHIMRLVEVVTHDATDPTTRERAVGFARMLGKEPIVVKDSPGFASSRLGVVLGLEAMRMLEAGVASAEDIDRAMELGYNHPMGPLKVSDLVGLDVRLAIAEYLHDQLKLPHYAPPPILRDKVARGELGKKSGRGFYTWSD